MIPEHYADPVDDHVAKGLVKKSEDNGMNNGFDIALQTELPQCVLSQIEEFSELLTSCFFEPVQDKKLCLHQESKPCNAPRNVCGHVKQGQAKVSQGDGLGSVLDGASQMKMPSYRFRRLEDFKEFFKVCMSPCIQQEKKSFTNGSSDIALGCILDIAREIDLSPSVFSRLEVCKLIKSYLLSLFQDEKSKDNELSNFSDMDPQIKESSCGLCQLEKDSKHSTNCLAPATEDEKKIFVKESKDNGFDGILNVTSQTKLSPSKLSQPQEDSKLVTSCLSSSSQDNKGLTNQTGDVVFLETGVQVTLPPCELSQLVKIKDVIRICSLASTQTALKLASCLVLENYVEKLMRIFHECENSGDTKNLYCLNEIFINMFKLDSKSLLEIFFSEDTIFDVIGVLEYNPKLGKPHYHRNVLKNSSCFTQVMPITDPKLLAKIHQTYRVQYIQDVILYEYLLHEKKVFRTLSSFINYNKIAIVTMIQDDPKYLYAVFSILTDKNTPRKKLIKTLMFLKELCMFSQALESYFYQGIFVKVLVTLGLLDALEETLPIEDTCIKSTSIDILSLVIVSNPFEVHNHIVEQFKSMDKDQYFMDVIFDQICCDADPERRTAVKLFSVLWLLLFPRSPDLKGKSEIETKFRDFFHKHYMTFYLRLLMGKLVYPIREDIQAHIQLARLLDFISELLPYCEKHTICHVKYYFLNYDFLRGISAGLTSKYSFVALASVKFLRKIIGFKDYVHNMLLIKTDLFLPVIEIFERNNGRCSLLNSAILEMFQFIRMEKMNLLYDHIVHSCSDKYVRTLAALQRQCQKPFGIIKDQASVENVSSVTQRSEDHQQLGEMEAGKTETVEDGNASVKIQNLLNETTTSSSSVGHETSEEVSDPVTHPSNSSGSVDITESLEEAIMSRINSLRVQHSEEIAMEKEPISYIGSEIIDDVDYPKYKTLKKGKLTKEKLKIMYDCIVDKYPARALYVQSLIDVTIHYEKQFSKKEDQASVENVSPDTKSCHDPQQLSEMENGDAKVVEDTCTSTKLQDEFSQTKTSANRTRDSAGLESSEEIVVSVNQTKKSNGDQMNKSYEDQTKKSNGDQMNRSNGVQTNKSNESVTTGQGLDRAKQKQMQNDTVVITAPQCSRETKTKQQGPIISNSSREGEHSNHSGCSSKKKRKRPREPVTSSNSSDDDNSCAGKKGRRSKETITSCNSSEIEGLNDAKRRCHIKGKRSKNITVINIFPSEEGKDSFNNVWSEVKKGSIIDGASLAVSQSKEITSSEEAAGTLENEDNNHHNASEENLEELVERIVSICTSQHANSLREKLYTCIGIQKNQSKS